MDSSVILSILGKGKCPACTRYHMDWNISNPKPGIKVKVCNKCKAEFVIETTTKAVRIK